VRCARKPALLIDAQGFALDAAQALQQQAAVGIVVQQGQAFAQFVRHGHGVSFLVLPMRCREYPKNGKSAEDASISSYVIISCPLY
jgi:hypothetical protein